jgi:predicted nucleotidyltransferase
VEAVYVFGSFARGEEHEGSDIDLLVVGDLPGRAPARVGEVLRRTDLPVEPIVVRRTTLEQRCRQGLRSTCGRSPTASAWRETG